MAATTLPGNDPVLGSVQQTALAAAFTTVRRRKGGAANNSVPIQPSKLLVQDDGDMFTALAPTERMVEAPKPLNHVLGHVLQDLSEKLTTAQTAAQYTANRKPVNETEGGLGSGNNNLQQAMETALQGSLATCLNNAKTHTDKIAAYWDQQQRFSEHDAWSTRHDLLAQEDTTRVHDCCAPSSSITPTASVASDTPPTPKTRLVRALNRLFGGHSHEHGTILIDVDEAVHALWALCKQMGVVVQGKASEFLATLKADAKHFTEHPLQDPGQHLVPKAVPDFALSMVLNLAMGVFAVLAMKAGWGEWQHANETLPALKQRLQKMQAWVKSLEGSAKDELLRGRGAAGALYHAWQTQVHNVQTAIKLTRIDKRVGQASFFSGAAILLKSAMDMGLVIGLGLRASASSIRKGFEGFNFVQTTLGGASKLAASTGVAGMATTVVGLAGSVLAPIAGAGAAYMGLKLRAKASLMLKRYANFEVVKNHLCTLQGRYLERSQNRADDQTKVDQFLQFVSRQHTKRFGFFSAFKQKMNWFAGGSLAYAAVSVVKLVGIVLLALGAAGAVAGVFSNPITAGVFLAVAIVGGLCMLYGGTGLLFGHPKQANYCEVVGAEHPWVDRNTLTQVLHADALEGDNAPASIQRDAMAYAISCLQQLDAYKQAREGFLQALVDANVARKKARWHPLSCFACFRQAKPTCTPKAFAQQYGLRKRVSQLLNGKPQAWAAHKAWVVLKALPQWLGAKIGGVCVAEQDVLAFMGADTGKTKFLVMFNQFLLAEQDHLRQHIGLRLRLVSSSHKPEQWQEIVERNPEQSLQQVKNLVEVLGVEDEALRQDLIRLEKNLDCQNDLRAFNGTEHASASTSTQGSTSSGLQGFQKYDWDKSVEKYLLHMGVQEGFKCPEKALAEWVCKGWDGQIRTARGILFDTVMVANTQAHGTTPST